VKPKAQQQKTLLSTCCWDSRSLLLFALDCPRAASGSLIPIHVPERAADVPEISSNKSFLIVEAESGTQTYIRRNGKSWTEIFAIPPLSEKSN